MRPHGTIYDTPKLLQYVNISVLRTIIELQDPTLRSRYCGDGGKSVLPATAATASPRAGEENPGATLSHDGLALRAPRTIRTMSRQCTSCLVRIHQWYPSSSAKWRDFASHIIDADTMAVNHVNILNTYEIL